MVNEPLFAPAGASIAGPSSDARRMLRRNRAVATGLLLAMVLAFGVSLLLDGNLFAVRLLRAAAEAGIVGSMADWFAVTALFRHPLGLPIPHTAILARNKDRFGRTLGDFVEQNFLTPEVLPAKLRQGDFVRRFAAWLARPQTAGLIAGQVSAALPQLLRALDVRELRNFLARTLGEQIRGVDLAPVLGRAAQVLTATGEADVLLSRIADFAITWLNQNRGTLDDIVLRRSRWWIPKAINLQIARSIVEGATELLEGLRRPGSETRAKFRTALAATIGELVNSPQQRERINALKEELLADPVVRGWTAAVWQQLSDALLADLAAPESRIRAALEASIASIGRALEQDAAMQARLADLLDSAAIQLIARRSEIGGFIAEVIAAWDARTVSDRVELMIGSDLQYIRMNGTVVGAGVGCLLFLASWLIAQVH
jgi:uncharacterized membrane-anchored protein YjiN (DUF445 family)